VHVCFIGNPTPTIESEKRFSILILVILGAFKESRLSLVELGSAKLTYAAMELVLAVGDVFWPYSFRVFTFILKSFKSLPT
jgi:hypothetical protein